MEGLDCETCTPEAKEARGCGVPPLVVHDSGDGRARLQPWVLEDYVERCREEGDDPLHGDLLMPEYEYAEWAYAPQCGFHWAVCPRYHLIFASHAARFEAARILKIARGADDPVLQAQPREPFTPRERSLYILARNFDAYQVADARKEQQRLERENAEMAARERNAGRM